MRFYHARRPGEQLLCEKSCHNQPCSDNRKRPGKRHRFPIEFPFNPYAHSPLLTLNHFPCAYSTKKVSLGKHMKTTGTLCRHRTDDGVFIRFARHRPDAFDGWSIFGTNLPLCSTSPAPKRYFGDKKTVNFSHIAISQRSHFRYSLLCSAQQTEIPISVATPLHNLFRQ